MPGHWVLGTVLWAQGEELLVNRESSSGQSYRQVFHVSEVRAVGSIEQLGQVQRKAVDEVRELSVRVNVAERVLGDAQDAVWKRIDQLVAAGVAILAPDFAWIDRANADVQAAASAVDAEEAL